jgi:hypothetical protein
VIEEACDDNEALGTSLPVRYILCAICILVEDGSEESLYIVLLRKVGKEMEG